MVVSVVFLFAMLCHLNGDVDALNDEGYALLTFKRSIFRDPDGSLSNWNSSDQNPCSWNGVTCKDQSVVSVSIPKKKLLGFLPSSLRLLSNLRHLNLRSNQLNGTLPVELFEAQGLQSVVLYGNSLSGSIPDNIGKLIFLQNLDLSRNLFSGSIPESILQCKRLRNLDLSGNHLTGSLPGGFDHALASLEKLDLSFNKFNGIIPRDLGNLANFQGTLDLSHNLFSGLIPASLGNLSEKVYIDISYNNLSGEIPQTGALVNRGQATFIGNPRLCGPPLKNPCSNNAENSPSSHPYLPPSHSHGAGLDDNSEGSKKGRGLSKSAIIAIIVCDVIGVALLGLLFSCCYLKICSHENEIDERICALEKEGKERKGLLCLKMNESETPSDNVEQHDLVLLDTHVTFDLDELLKASAFVLGKSGKGIVYKVVLEDGLTLAVRRLGEGGSQRFKEFRTEVQAIGKLRHSNIATLRAYYWSVDEKLLIYDYIPNGSLANALHGNPEMRCFAPLSWPVRLKIIKGIARGLVYLHEFSPKKYVHGSLKPSNVLLGHNMEPRISDFGLVRLSNIAGGSPLTLESNISPSDERSQDRPSNKVSSSTSLSSYYKAPEALKAMKPSQKWDVYSYGVILLEMITGRLPAVYVGKSKRDIVRWMRMCIEEKKEISDILDPYLAPNADMEKEIIGVLRMAMACVNNNPEKRPSMKHIYEALNQLAVFSG